MNTYNYICNHQLLMPNLLGIIYLSQKEIGPALTPLIREINQDRQGYTNEREIEKLIAATKSLAGSLFDPVAEHIEEDLEETQTLNRSIIKSYHHQQQCKQQRAETPQTYSMMLWGIFILSCSSFLWIIGIPLILFDLDSLSFNQDNSTQHYKNSYTFMGWFKWLLIKILDDQHYKFFIPLQITLGLIFVIINWGGLKIFRHS
ncbi:hypothetical protein PSTG_06093 [Puccinia striiformis f. sp. tritici PST-78]|uniref:Uncharacterized protein n=1 Tax=Puccinia striiformis f. sp. tritici PST-78 TaxID=1165861 RepID=A0A0L0VNT9_9BASI|nr:hypothetical protein PSTG_06093 [Puccinia striiformis f. sp. tritici PST-78]